MLKKRWFQSGGNGPTPIDWSWVTTQVWEARLGAVVIAALGVILCWRVGWQAWLPAGLFFILIGGLLALCDLFTQRLPNRLIAPAIVVQSALFAVAAPASRGWSAFDRSLLGAACLAVFYGAFALTTVMGGGDVKFGILIGETLGWIGWSAVVTGLLAGLLLFLLTGYVLIVARRLDRRAARAFAPFAYVGAAIVLCLLAR